MATLPGAWCYRVSAGTGRPGVSTLWLGEVESLICNFCLSVAARKIVWADRPWDTLACCWDVKQPTNQPTARCHERVSAGTGWRGVGKLSFGERESLICSFHLSAVSHTIVWADLFLRYLTCCWDLRQPTNKICGCVAGHYGTLTCARFSYHSWRNSSTANMNGRSFVFSFLVKGRSLVFLFLMKGRSLIFISYEG